MLYTMAQNNSTKKGPISTHLKDISQMGSFPQVGVKIENIGNHDLDTEQKMNYVKKKDWVVQNWRQRRQPNFEPKKLHQPHINRVVIWSPPPKFPLIS